MGHTMSGAAHLRGFRRDDESRSVSECPGVATSVATVRAVDESPKFLEVLWQYGSEDQKVHLPHGGDASRPKRRHRQARSLRGPRLQMWRVSLGGNPADPAKLKARPTSHRGGSSIFG